MAVKLNKLKTKKVRATVPVVVDGNMEEIKIFNPTPEQRIYFHEKLNDKVENMIDEDGKINIGAEEVLRLFYTELTDLEIEDEDSILEVIMNPSREILLVAQHINQIVHELVMEIMINKQMELNKIRELKQQGELILGTRNLLESLGIEEEKLKELGLDINESIIADNKTQEK